MNGLPHIMYSPREAFILTSAMIGQLCKTLLNLYRWYFCYERTIPGGPGFTSPCTLLHGLAL